jgi:hypothetical protein
MKPQRGEICKARGNAPGNGINEEQALKGRHKKDPGAPNGHHFANVRNMVEEPAKEKQAQPVKHEN